MAADYLNHLAGGPIEVRSAGLRVSDLVRQMQRRAFEVPAGWADIEERELDPAGLDRH